jgi:predicted DNA-binding WGR domain protein
LRIYVLSIQPTLFRGVSLVRHWGGIGTLGQSMVETFDDLEEDDDALNRLERELSRCRAASTKCRRLKNCQAVSTAVRQVSIAAARSARCVWAEVR